MIMNIIASKDFVTGLIICDIQIYIISEVVQGGEMLFPKVYIDMSNVITFTLTSISPDAMLARDRQQGDLQSLARGGRRAIPNCQDQGLG